MQGDIVRGDRQQLMQPLLYNEYGERAKNS